MLLATEKKGDLQGREQEEAALEKRRSPLAHAAVSACARVGCIRPCLEETIFLAYQARHRTKRSAGSATRGARESQKC